MEQFLDDHVDIIMKIFIFLAGTGFFHINYMIFKSFVFCFTELKRKLEQTPRETLESDYGKLFINGGIGVTDKDKLDELTTYYMENSNHFIRLNSQGEIVQSGWKVTSKAQDD